MRRPALWLCLFLWGSLGAPALELPRISGNLEGKLTLRGYGACPVLAWRLSAPPEAGPGQAMQAVLSGPGLTIRLELIWGKDGSATWRLQQGQMDLAQWWRPLATRAGLIGRLPSDFALAGVVALTGEGRLHRGQLQGCIGLRVAQGSAGSGAQKWSLADWEATAEMDLSPTGPRLRTLHCNAREAEVAGMPIRHLVIAATGEGPDRLKIEEAGAEVLGGRIALRPFAVNPFDPEVNTAAELQGVALGDLAALIPEALSEARGQLSGRVSVRWSASVGLRPGEGLLAVTPDAPATLRLKATPGFITSRVNKRIVWLPAQLGFLARLLAVPNPAYDTLRRIELGELPLQVEKMAIQLFPDGPDGVRSAVAHIETRPPGDTLVKKVTFDVNVAGPLDQVLRLGADDRVKISTGTNP